MFRKLTIALVATASLAPRRSLPPPRPPRRRHGWRHGRHHHLHFGPASAIRRHRRLSSDDVAMTSCFVTHRVMTPYGYRMRTVNVCALLIQRSVRRSPRSQAAAGVFRAMLQQSGGCTNASN